MRFLLPGPHHYGLLPILFLFFFLSDVFQTIAERRSPRTRRPRMTIARFPASPSLFAALIIALGSILTAPVPRHRRGLCWTRGGIPTTRFEASSSYRDFWQG